MIIMTRQLHVGDSSFFLLFLVFLVEKRLFSVEWSKQYLRPYKIMVMTTLNIIIIIKIMIIIILYFFVKYTKFISLYTFIGLEFMILDGVLNDIIVFSGT